MKRKPIRRRLKNLAYYLLAGLVPFMLAVMTYFKISDIMYEEALSSKINKLRNKQELIDSFLFNVQSTGYMISNEASIQTITLLNQISGADISILLDAISKTKIGNTIFDPVQRQVLCGCYVFFTDSRIVLNIQTRVAFLTSKWQYPFHIDGMTADQWFDHVFSEQGRSGFIPKVNLSINGTPREVALYLQPVQMGMGHPRAMAVIAVDMNRFASMVGSSAQSGAVCLIDNGSGHFYPSDREGNELKLLYIQMSDGESRRVDINGQDSVVMTVQSSYTNWSLLQAVPYHSIAPASGKFQLLISLTGVAIILFAILITIVAAHLNNKPIREISRMLFALKKPPASDAEPGLPPSRDMDDVSYGVQQLINLNQSIQIDLDEYRDRLRYVMLDRLLEGKIQRETELQECSRLLDGLFTHRGYAVTLLHIGADKNYVIGMDIENVYMQRMAVIRHLAPGSNEIIHEVSTSDEIVIITLIDDDPSRESITERLRERAGALLAHLGKMGHTNIKIGIGSICERPIDISRSAEQARIAMFMTEKNAQVVLYDSRYHESADTYYYPLEEERRLVNTVRSGNRSEVRCILKDIYEENYVRRKLSRQVLDQLGQEIQGTLTKLTSNMPPDVSAVRERCERGAFPDPVFDRQCGEIIGLCACFAENKHTSLETTVQQIIDYLETVYMDENISLNNVAERFCISEAYLSRIFKERSGENFSACLERIRMNHAQRLLSQTRIPIHEIGHRVGYAYYDTFRKAFKRTFGVSPSDYRAIDFGKTQTANPGR